MGDVTVGLASSSLPQLYNLHGYNDLPEPKEVSLVTVFLAQFNSILVYLLLLAAGISLLAQEYTDVGVILGIVLLNGLIGFLQEAKAKAEVAALRKLTVAFARVIRDGKEQKIEAKFLVPGDVVVVESGDKIPADGEVIWEQGLSLNEASLTGESLPVAKHSKDSVYLATIVLAGRAHFVVTKTGKNSKFGEVAQTLKTLKEEPTPLEVRLQKFSQKLVIVVVVMIVLVIIIGIFQNRPWVELTLSAVALAVAAIPEGLPAVLTIALALGTRRLASKRAIVKRLAVAEALGSVNVICTDKTGTLTKNEMVVEKIWLASGQEYTVSGVGFSSDGQVIGPQSPELLELIKIGVLCNSANLTPLGTDTYSVLGDTTEGALLILAKKVGIDIESLRLAHPINQEIPFDSRRKTMTVVSQGVSYLKGAPEALSSDQVVHSIAKKWGSAGYRVLALTDGKVLGLVALADAPREEVATAIKACTDMGITPLMITGDSPETALAIGCAVGMATPLDPVMTGKQLLDCSDDELVAALGTVRIFSRVDPLQKLRIVQLLQKMGKVVAVTGDGVNDGPALKKAEVGVAMGITGSDVAKEAADLIITDDNFATIVAAVSEGRLIFANLTKTIRYLLASNLGEVVVVVAAMILWLPLPFAPLVLLWVNVVGDGLPALALAVDNTKDEKLLLPPRSSGFLQLPGLLSLAAVVAVPTFLAFLLSLQYFPELVPQITFSALIVMEVVAAFVVRGRDQQLLGNRPLLIAVSLTLLAQGVILFVPAVAAIMFS